MTTPSQPTELDKAIESAERTAKKFPLSWGAYLGQYFMEQLLLAAKRLKEVEKALVNSNDAAEKLEVMLKEIEKERDELKHKLNVCKEAYSRDTKDDETYAKKLQVELTQLRAEYKQAVDSSRSIEMLIAELEGAFMGLMMHPSDYPINGCLISAQSKEKLKCIEDIIKRYKVLSTPSAIAAMKGK